MPSLSSKTLSSRNFALGDVSSFSPRKIEFAPHKKHRNCASLDSAKEQAGRQQLFFVEVIKPNLPEKPDRPRPWRTALALLVGLSVAFSIGWLVLAGIREHEAV